jgi:hypothetical protein
VLLTEKFGDVRMTEAFRKINDEYAALTDAAKSEKERTRLEKERQGVISDLAAIRDRIRGTYAISSEAPMRNAARAMNVLKNYNVLTSMGSAALSSLPDMAGVVMRHGLTATFNDAWTPFFKMLTRQDDIWKEAGRQYRAMGIAVESTLAARHHALTDTLDTYHPQSRVERTMQWATGKFQFVNMLAPWTDFAKVNASMVAGSEILRADQGCRGGTPARGNCAPSANPASSRTWPPGSPRRSRRAARSAMACTCRTPQIGPTRRPGACSRARSRAMRYLGAHPRAGKAAVDVAPDPVRDRPVQVVHRGRDRAHPDLEPSAPRCAGAAGPRLLDGARHALLQAEQPHRRPADQRQAAGLGQGVDQPRRHARLVRGRQCLASKMTRGGVDVYR